MDRGQRFLAHPNPPVKRYRKAGNIGLTGYRLHPTTGQPMIFILMSSKPEFDPDTDVVELYSQEEVAYFLRANSSIIKSGALLEYTEEEFHDDTVEPETERKNNTMSDEEIREMLKIRKFETFSEALNKITSIYTMMRIKEIAAEVGLYKKFYTAIEERFEALK